MGSAINLVNDFKVEKVIFNCGEFNELEQELIKVLDKKEISYYSCIKELNIDNILFNCRDILRAARNSGSFFEKRDMMLTLIFLRFIGEKYEDGYVLCPMWHTLKHKPHRA